MGFPQWIRGPILGRGSTATVSLGLDSRTGEKFAVKSAELDSSALLQREQRFLASVDSPHVVSYLGFDLTVEKGRSFYNLFMEYADGGSVADEVERRGGGGMEEWRIRKYAKGTLMGVSYLHSVGIAHCDVKGRNVLIGSDGEAKLADLGCARWVGGGDNDCRHRVFGGTPVFMAPEVARGEEQGMAADVWALGCTVIEMATGRQPWPEVSDPVSAVHRIAFSADVPEFPKWISDEGRDFLARCLRRDPSERWSADELLRHPFVADDKEIQSPFSPKPNWRSPKCVLDQDIWDSMEEEEEEAEKVSGGSDPIERLRQLRGGDVSCSAAISSWTWNEENWIAVRGGADDNGCSTSTAAGVPAVKEPIEDTLSSNGCSISSTDSFPSNYGYFGGNCDQRCNLGDIKPRWCDCLQHMAHVGNSIFMANDVTNSCYSCCCCSVAAVIVIILRNKQSTCDSLGCCGSSTKRSSHSPFALSICELCTKRISVLSRLSSLSRISI